MTPALKNALYGVMSAVIISILGATWVGIGKAQAGLNQLSINTQAIENIGMAMELRGIDRTIESKQKEIRDKEIDILNHGENTALINLLNTQIKTLNAEISVQVTIRACVVDPAKKICK